MRELNFNEIQNISGATKHEHEVMLEEIINVEAISKGYERLKQDIVDNPLSTALAIPYIGMTLFFAKTIAGF